MLTYSIIFARTDLDLTVPMSVAVTRVISKDVIQRRDSANVNPDMRDYSARLHAQAECLASNIGY